MAKNISTRIGLKIDTLTAWESSTIGLRPGELAIATVAAGAGSGLSEPVIMIKVGEDGVKTFKDLDWAVHAKASDVYGWAKKSEADFVNSFLGLTNGTKTIRQILDEIFITHEELANALAQLKIGLADIYYNKTEIDTLLGNYYTKTEIDGMIGDLDVGAIEGRVDNLETAVGTTLPGQISAVDAKFADYAKTADVYSKTEADGKFLTEHQSLANYYTKGEVDGELEKKQDVIPANTYDAYGSAAAVEAKLADYTKTADLPTDLGDFTNNAGYAKTAEVTETLKDYYTKGDIDSKVGTINGAIDLKADKSFVEAMYTNEQIDGFVSTINGEIAKKADADKVYTKDEADGKFADAEEYAATKTLVDNFFDEAGGAENVRDTLVDIITYITEDEQGAIQLAQDVADAKSAAADAVETANNANATAGTANTVAGEAKALAEEAKEAATNATTGAAASAEAAAASAFAAKGSEEAAKGYAEAAAADADDAEAARAAAVVAQSAAEAAQRAAAGSEANAGTAKADAEAAKSAAVAAQSAAEAAKAGAVSAQEAAAGSASAAAVSAENAGNAKIDAEAAKSAAEAAQVKAEAAQAAAEASNTSATAIANNAAEVAGQAKTAAEKATSDVAGLTETVNAIPTTYRKVADKITSDDMSDEVWVFNCGTASLVK